MQPANDNPKAEVVIHPGVKRQREMVARIINAGYGHITYRDGQWRTVHHSKPSTRVVRGINPRGGPSPSPGPGTAA